MHRRAVFEAVYFGKKAVKTVQDISDRTQLGHKQVLTAAKPMVKSDLFKQVGGHGKTAYEKDDFFANNKVKILKLAGNKAMLDAFPTKSNPRQRNPVVSIQYKMPKSLVSVREVTVDDIASFAKVRSITGRNLDPVRMPEKRFKEGTQAVIGETGRTFKDWGGEQNDLWTSRLKLKSTRVSCAIAFKGPGTRGKLTPAKMGKNGDQIARLFRSAATLFLLQYWDVVEESVYDHMRAFAVSRSIEGTGMKVVWGVIDGVDSARLIKAYPKAYKIEEG
jgi:hypothetical protein